MSKEFEMSEEDLNVLIAACKKQKSLKKDLEIASREVNKFWEALGVKMGFDHATAKPSGKDPAKFIASPVEPYSQKIPRGRGLTVSLSSELPPTFDKDGCESLKYKDIT